MCVSISVNEPRHESDQRPFHLTVKQGGRGGGCATNARDHLPTIRRNTSHQKQIRLHTCTLGDQRGRSWGRSSCRCRRL